MPEHKTDISDKTWDDLQDADYDVLRELAKERDDVRGDGSRDEICAGLLASEGRPDAVPDEYQHLVDGNDDDTEVESDDDTEVESDDDTDSDDDDGTDFQRATNYEPEIEANFIIEAGPLSKWIDHQRTLIDEARIHLEPEGFRVTAVDAANVGMVTSSLEARGFQSYDLEHEGVIGVNIERLHTVLSGADDDDRVSLTYDGVTRNLIVRYGGHEFTVALIDPESIRAEPDLPDLELPVEVVMDAGTLQVAASNANDVSDHLGISATSEGVLHVSAEGDTDSYEYDSESGDDEIEVVETPGEAVSSLFSLDYITDTIKPFDSDVEIRLELGQDFPILFEGSIEYDEQAIGEARYMVAPRIRQR